MIKQKGLSLKIFIFVFCLITVVIMVSFGVLYFTLPGFYYYQKNNTLEKNAETLKLKLDATESEDEYKELISNFAKLNNSNVVCYGSDGNFIPELSSPFIFINEIGGESIKFRFTQEIDNDLQYKEMTLTPGIKIAQEKGETAEHNIIITDVFVAASTDEEVSSPVKIQTENNKSAYLMRGDITNAIVEKFLQNNTIKRMLISSTLQPIDEAKGVLISLIPYLLIFDFIIAWIASYLFSKQLTKPILRISNAAAMMKEMKQDVLSNVRTNDELGQLSKNLDSLYLSLCENIESLKVEMDKTAALEQSKTEFMRAAGHELKTPIAALNGMIEGMIDNVGVYKNHNKYLNESKQQVDRLAELVNDILISTSCDYAGDNPEIEHVSILELIDEAINAHELIAEKKKLVIIRNIYDFSFKTDAHMLLSVFLNLISNAVKYSPPKTKINITMTENENENILFIENECQHINEDLLPKLFEPFFTLNFSRNRSESGTGLGLYIVKRNLEKLGLPFNIKNTKNGIIVSVVFSKNFGF